MLVVRLLNVLKQWETNLVPIIGTKRRKNPEFHIIKLTEIFCVKSWKFPFDIFDACQHGDGLVNVVTGKINNYPSVNFGGSIRLGEDQMKNFDESLPGGFCDIISGKVKGIADGNKSVKVGKKIVLDPEVIYARALALQDNPFLANVPILYPLETPENLWFSGVFRGYKMETLAKNGLIHI